MPRGGKDALGNTTDELLIKILVVLLHLRGTTTGAIAKIVGKHKGWVGDIVRNIPKSG
jgi:hypothetical protein